MKNEEAEKEKRSQSNKKAHLRYMDIIKNEEKKKALEKQRRQLKYEHQKEVLHIDEIIKLVNLLGMTSGIKHMHVDGILFNGKEYCVDINDTRLDITCSDGWKVAFETFLFSDKSSNGYTWDTSCFGLVFVGPKQDALYFGGKWYYRCDYIVDVTPENLIGSIDDVVYYDKFDFTESLSRSYQYPDSYGGIRLTWDLFPASVSKTKKGHLSYHHYLLSKDGNTIISFNNKKIQDFESLKEEAQELETEVEKVYNFINKEQFSKVTIQELLNALRQVQKRIKNNRLQMLRHQEIPGVVQNLLLRQKYATEIYQSISKAELDNLALVLEQEIVKKRKEIEEQKTFENTPEGRMKKLAESLSLTDIIILKKYLIKKGP